jgi:tetratricopeptide (TPR) repeat protein
VACTQHSKKIPAYNHKTISLQLIDSLKNESQNIYENNIQPIEYDAFLKEAVAIAKNSQNDSVLFDLYMMVAKRYRKSSDFGAAIEILQNALELANKMDNTLLKAHATHEMAVNFRRINDNAQALKLHTQALELSENVEDTFLIHCSHNGVGNVYFDYKDYRKAIESFHKSLQYLGNEKPNYLGEAINSNLLGEAWLFLGNTDSALYYLNRSFNANLKIGSELGKAICHDGMGLVYNKTKEYNKAIYEHNLALEVYEKIGNRYYQAMCLTNIGNTYFEMKLYKTAELFFKKALEIGSEIGSKRFALEASLKLGELYNKVGEANNSFKFITMAMAYKDSITEELQEQNTDAMHVLYKAEKQEREILILMQNAELSRLKMTRQLYIFTAIVSVTIVLIFFIVLVFRQRRLKSKLCELGLEQKLLRAQLNPHFVFNSLSAVQNFILHNDKKAASEYLVNFSRLMRNILVGSGTDFILLENELEILDDYLKLQQLRFLGKFDYFFVLSQEIDPQPCMGPPMLLQPCIENSIELGVRDIDRQGTIIIRFNKNYNTLVIEIEDNGRGLIDQEVSNKERSYFNGY